MKISIPDNISKHKVAHKEKITFEFTKDETLTVVGGDALVPKLTSGDYKKGPYGPYVADKAGGTVTFSYEPDDVDDAADAHTILIGN